MREVDPITEAIGMNTQALSRAAEDRTLWTSLIHKVARSPSSFNDTGHPQR